MASRAQLVEEVIAPALAAGRVVVSDRYLLANIVYQGSAGGLLEEEIALVGMVATGGLLPDLTLVLDIAPDAAAARVGPPRDRIEDRPLFYHERVRAGYLAAARRSSHGAGDTVPAALSCLLSRADRLDRCVERSRHRLRANHRARLSVSWHSVRGHDRVVESLRTSLRQGRFPHALLVCRARRGSASARSRASWRRPFCARRARTPTSTRARPAPAAFRSTAGTHPDFIEAGQARGQARAADQRDPRPVRPVRLEAGAGADKVAILDDADDLNEEASNAFLKTLEEPPPGAVLDPDRHLGRASARDDRLAVPGRAVRPAARGGDRRACCSNRESPRDAADAARLAALGEGSVSRAIGLADAELERFRRSLIDEVAAEHGFDPAGPGPSASRLHQAGRQGIGRPAPPGQPA